VHAGPFALLGESEHLLAASEQSKALRIVRSFALLGESEQTLAVSEQSKGSGHTPWDRPLEMISPQAMP
jgi:hypothetical protein